MHASELARQYQFPHTIRTDAAMFSRLDVAHIDMDRLLYKHNPLQRFHSAHSCLFYRTIPDQFPTMLFGCLHHV